MPGSEAPPPWTAREAVGVVAAAFALAVLMSWPLVLHPTTRLVGSPFGEVDNHFWMFWRDRQGAGPWTNWPAGWEIPLMDPIDRPLAWLGGLAGPVAAYNLVVLGNLLLAAFGGYVLAREVTGRRAAAWVGLAATGAAPFLGGLVEFGITEALPVGWLALHAASALAWTRRGAARDLVAAGAFLAAFLASGWYHAAFAIVAEAWLVGTALAAPRRAAALVFAAALAGATRVPALLDLLAHHDLWAARFHGVDPPLPFLPDWRDVPRYGADLVPFVLPRLDAAPVSRTVYLGLLPLLLALAARRRWLLGAAASLLVLALGHRLHVAGHLAFPGLLPAGWLVAHVPALAGLSHWDRATGPLVVFLAAAAASGAARLRTPAAGPALAVLIVAESLTLAPTRFPRATYTPDPPAALLALPGDAPLLQLPIDDVGAVFDPPRSRRPFNQWQVFHGHPVAENYEGPDAVLAVPGVAALNVACGAPGPRHPPPPPADLADRLARVGFGWVVVHVPLARPGCADAVAAVLGPGVAEPGVVRWALPTPPTR